MRVDWGIKASSVEDFDRSRQFKPYDGPPPVNGVYQWRVKVLKFVEATDEKLPQLRIGLELKPRKGRPDDKKFSGYFIMLYPPVADHVAFRYVPFLDAIGVSGSDFQRRTIADNDGNIKSIGKWRNTGEEVILGELVDSADESGRTRKDIRWMGAAGEDVDEEESYDEEEYDSDEDYDDEEDEEWEGE